MQRPGLFRSSVPEIKVGFLTSWRGRLTQTFDLGDQMARNRAAQRIGRAQMQRRRTERLTPFGTSLFSIPRIENWKRCVPVAGRACAHAFWCG